MSWADSTAVRGLWLGADGTSSGPDFNVHTPAGQDQPRGTVSGVQAGGVGLVVWQSRLNNLNELFGQRVNPDGTLLGTVFPVLAAPIADGPSPLFFYHDLAILPSGEFVVVWQAQAGDGSPDQFFARHFRRDGVPLTGEVLLNLPSFSEEISPRIAATSNQGFVIVWQNEDGRDGDLDGIFAQRYEITSDEVFGDSFELGSTSAWSMTVP